MLRFVSMGRNNAFKVVTQSYFNTDHMIDYCVVKVFMVLLKTKTAWVIKFFKFTKRPWIRHEYIPDEQRFTDFVVRNEQRFTDFVVRNEQRF